MLLKRIISLLVLTMYLHGMSGYSMNFHKCTITGFEKVYAGYNVTDPCGPMDDMDCQETQTHFDRADCCDVTQTFVNVEEDGNKTELRYNYFLPFNIVSHAGTLNLVADLSKVSQYEIIYVPPISPELNKLCVFRI